MTSWKRSTVAMLRPLAAGWKASERLRRAWYHARAAASLRHPVPPSSVLLGPLDVHGTGNIRLGEDLYLYADVHLETQDEGSIDIGDGVVMSRGVHIVSFSEIVLEEGAMVGEYASLRDANHRVGVAGGLRHSGHDSAPIHVGRNAWIGRGVTVLGGVTIGERAVVGANSVVTRDVPAGAIAVGAPARVLEGRSTLPGVA